MHQSPRVLDSCPRPLRPGPASGRRRPGATVGMVLWVLLFGGGLLSAACDTAEDGGDGLDAGTQDGGADGAPGPTYGWTRQIGSTESENATALAGAADLTLVVTGTFGGTVDFSSGGEAADSRSAKGGQDVYVAKLDYSNDYHWTHAFGGTGVDKGLATVVAADGSIYVAGSFSGTVDFDPPQGNMPGVHKTDVHVAASGAPDAFVTKLGAGGEYLWTRTFGGKETEAVRGLALVGDDVFVVGTFNGQTDLDPAAPAAAFTAAGDTDLFVSRLDSSGAYVAGRALGGPGAEQVGGTASVGTDGSFLLVGSFAGATDLGAGAVTAAGGTDAFAVLIGADGQPAWSRTWGGAGDDTAQSAAAGGGDLAVAGAFSGTADLDPGTAVAMRTSKGKLDAYALRLAADGGLKWIFTAGGPSDDDTGGVGFAGPGPDAGAMYLYGRFQGRVEVMPGRVVNSTGAFPDVFVAALDSGGTATWVRTFNASFEEPGRGLIVLDDASIVIGGWFEGRVDFDASEKNDFKAAIGGWDIFVTRLETSS